MELKRLKQEIKLREDALPEAEVNPLFEKWQAEKWQESPKLSTLPPRDGLVAHYEFDGHLSDTSGHYHHGHVTRGGVTFGSNVIGLGGEGRRAMESRSPKRQSSLANRKAIYGRRRFQDAVIRRRSSGTVASSSPRLSKASACRGTQLPITSATTCGRGISTRTASASSTATR